MYERLTYNLIRRGAASHPTFQLALGVLDRMLRGIDGDDGWAWRTEEEKEQLTFRRTKTKVPHSIHRYSTSKNTVSASRSPFTVRATSLSATPIRGTMALQVYVPASSWVTAFSCRVLPLLSTYDGSRATWVRGGTGRTVTSGSLTERWTDHCNEYLWLEFNFIVKSFNHSIRHCSHC